jgi:hypothetical protein
MKVLKSSDRQHVARVCCTRAGQVLGLTLWVAQALASPLAVTGMPAPLTSVVGDPLQGLRIAEGREGQCALCHELPGSNVRQSNTAPGLDGVAKRLSSAVLRLRLVDSRQINPYNLIPAYHLTLN